MKWLVAFSILRKIKKWNDKRKLSRHNAYIECPEHEHPLMAQGYFCACAGDMREPGTSQIFNQARANDPETRVASP